MSALLEAVIAEAGWDAPQRLPINGIVRSERVTPRGEASVEVETATLRRAGLLDCRGRWLRHEHGDLGAWAGVIQQVRHDGATGTTEVAAQSFEALLDAKRTAKTYHVTDGDAGDVARKVIADAARDGSAFIEGYDVGPTGLVDIDLRAEQVADAVDQLAQLADAEYGVTTGRRFRFAKRLGEDKSASVVLMEGREVGARWEVVRDLAPIVNDLAAFSGVEEYTRQTAVVVRDDESIDAIGQRQGSRYFPYLVKQSALRPAARAELDRLLRLGRAATVEVVNVGRVWSAFRAGDTVRLLLPSCGVDRRFRVLVRTWDSDGDQVVVTGEWSEREP